MLDLPSAASIETYRIGLVRLLGFIDRTVEHLSGGPPEGLLAQSLATRLDPLGQQIFAACRHAEHDLASAAGLATPSLDQPVMALPALRARVERALAFVQSIAPESIDEGLMVEYGPARQRMLAMDYLRHYSTPHFYFHLSVIYVTLRKNGIPLAKSDFVRDLDVDRHAAAE